jgi:hypothetical protein
MKEGIKMVENGFVYAVQKANSKKMNKEEKLQDKKEKAMETIKRIQSKYDFSFGYMKKSDSERMTKTDRTAYYKAIKLTTGYKDNYLSRLGLC